MKKFEGAPSKFLDAAVMQAEHDMEFGMQAARYPIGGKFPLFSATLTSSEANALRRGIEFARIVKQSEAPIISPAEHAAVMRTMQAYVNDRPRTVPVRRGTGPKASVKKFLEAYDAWAKYRRDNDPMEWGDEELEEDDRLFCAMAAARAEVRGVMGAT